MIPQSLVRICIAFSLLGCFFNRNMSFAQVQDFESNFMIVNHPEEFLPDWSANEVRSTAARIFQATGEGRFGSRALGVQAISSFNGEIYARLSTIGIEEPKIAFFAKTRQNGSGNRPVLVNLKIFGATGDEVSFQVGGENSFPNQNTPYRLYEFGLPEQFWEKDEVLIKIEVLFGPGSGSAARFFMDDFGIFNGNELIDPIQVRSAFLLNPYAIEIQFDREIKEPNSSQVMVSGHSVIDIIFPTDSTLQIYTEQLLGSRIVEILLLGLQDNEGNVTPEIEIDIANEAILLGEILVTSPRTILASFSHFFLESSVAQTSNFQVNGRQPSNIEIEENGYQAHLIFPEDFELGSWLTIVANNIQNEHSEATITSSREIRYHDFIESLFLMEQDLLGIFHELEIRTDSIDGLLFKLEENDAYSFEVFKPEPKQIQLRSNQLFEEGPVYTLEIPLRWSERGMPLHASKREFVWDRTPPEPVNVTPIDQQKILVSFSEPLDPVYATLPSLYALEDRHPTEVMLQQNNSQVLLSWDFSFEAGLTYTLLIEKMVDLSGNQSTNKRIDFEFAPPTRIAFKELVINEVMAAPRAGNSLPNVEYVELYNTSDRPIYIGGIQLANSRRVTTIPSAVLGQKAYIILAPRARTGEFTQYGDVLGLTNWPTLLNTADHVKIMDDSGTLLDSLGYNTASYGGNSFSQGGYSLEIANPYLACHIPTNLKASEDIRRGTPGQVNSVYETSPDLSPPRFIRSVWLGERKVLLAFSKVLSNNLAVTSWEVSPNINVSSIKAGENPTDILLEFEEDLQEGIRYTVRISNLRDCTGNLLEEKEEVWVVVPSKPEAKDIALNEVLFNARTNAPKFIEIYNCSNKYINMKDWKLANLNSAGEIANRRILFHEDYILEPFSFLVFTTDAGRLKQEYPKSKEDRFIAYSSLPSYPISSGNVVLLDPEEELVEIFSYSDRMHHPLLRETRGVSLERLSVEFEVNDPSNWQSASSSVGFATPGYRNSQVFDGQEEFGIEIQPKVFMPDVPGQPAFITISYKMEQPGKNASIRIYGVSGTMIREICQNAIWGMEGFYLWDGTDAQGRKVRPGYYIIWVELFDLQGNVRQIKKTAIVGTVF